MSCSCSEVGHKGLYLLSRELIAEWRKETKFLRPPLLLRLLKSVGHLQLTSMQSARCVVRSFC